MLYMAVREHPDHEDVRVEKPSKHSLRKLDALYRAMVMCALGRSRGLWLVSNTIQQDIDKVHAPRSSILALPSLHAHDVRIKTFIFAVI